MNVPLRFLREKNKMKHFGNIYFLTITVAVTLFGLFVTACVRDGNMQDDPNKISFSTGSARWIDANATKSDERMTGTITLKNVSGQDELYFHEYSESTKDQADNDAQTKAAPVTAMSGSFGVWAYSYAGTWSESCTPNLINDEEVYYHSGMWKTANDHFWPGSGKNVTFFAYAPYGQSGLTKSASAGTPVLTYIVPLEVAYQSDLLATDATTYAGDRNAAAPLSFKHILTSIKFVTGTIPACTINSISIKGVYGRGDYTLGASGWGSYGLKADFTIAVNKSFDGTSGVAITTDEQTLMMVPQTLPAGAKIELNVTDANSTHTITGSLAGRVWTMGQTITYSLSSTLDVPTLIVNGPADFTKDGGTNSYSVTSYVTNSSGVSTPVAWTAEYSTDGGITWSSTRPSWISTFTDSGSGGLTASTYSATISAQTSGTTHNGALQAATPLTDYDLSTKGGATSMSTANCYVINAAGTYKFPLVYGNAMKNGAANNRAYVSNATGDGVLHIFVNHLDAPIVDPYIFKNPGCVPDNAIIVWQDGQNLVTNVALDAAKHYITFSVPQANIQQGNAVLAVRDASNIILWSWHIWVTDYVPGLAINNDDGSPFKDRVVTNWQGHQYTMMPINLGWIDTSTDVFFPPRIAYVRFTQSGTTSAPVTIEVYQAASPISIVGISTYYQFGRKDPFPVAADIRSNNQHTIYNNSGSSISFRPTSGTATLGTAIKNPLSFYKGNNSDWCSTYYLNEWSIDENVMASETTGDNAISKSIYDPCPVGYHMAPNNAYTGFIYHLDEQTEIKQEAPYKDINSPYQSAPSSPTGWLFYCNKMTAHGTWDVTGGTIFFPLNGSIANNTTGNYSAVGYNGAFWTAVALDATQGRRLFTTFTNGKNPSSHIADINTYSKYYRAYGFCIRPVREY